MSFNGATAMKPWKSYLSVLPQADTTMLQWGHGDEAVEEQTSLRKRLARELASMGPRR